MYSYCNLKAFDAFAHLNIQTLKDYWQVTRVINDLYIFLVIKEV